MDLRAVALAGFFAAGAVLAGSGCTREPAEPAVPPRESGSSVTLLSFAIDGMREAPASAIDEAVQALAAAHPDILAAQIGHPDADPAPFLDACGRTFPRLLHREIVAPGDGASALVLLSRYPIVGRRSTPDLPYRIGERHHRIDPGLLDVDIVAEPHGLFRVVTARLKDKVFHVSGQTEMRRNEARILARRLRGDRDAPGQHLLVAAVLNDSPDSAPVREITEAGRPDLVPAHCEDTRGDTWTWHDPHQSRYERSDYVLVGADLEQGIGKGDARVLDAPALRALSSHRPLVVRVTGSR